MGFCHQGGLQPIMYEVFVQPGSRMAANPSLSANSAFARQFLTGVMPAGFWAKSRDRRRPMLGIGPIGIRRLPA
jgi:hypothetical protein